MVANCDSRAVFQTGNTILLMAEFTDLRNNNDPYNPTEVFLDVRDPDGTEVTYRYGIDPISNPQVGTYTFDLAVDIAGTWWVRWYSTGTGPASTEMTLTILGTVT